MFLRIGLIELFSIGGSIAAILAYFNNVKKKKDKRVTAHFIGGPLDGEDKKLARFNAVYVHKDFDQPGDALYKHKGYGYYVFDEFVEG